MKSENQDEAVPESAEPKYEIEEVDSDDDSNLPQTPPTPPIDIPYISANASGDIKNIPNNPVGRIGGIIRPPTSMYTTTTPLNFIQDTDIPTQTTNPTTSQYMELVVDLKVIGALDVNSRISTTGKFLNIEQPGYIPIGIRRWYFSDNRDATIRRIERTIGSVSDCLLHTPLDSDRQQVATHLFKARSGLVNLKETYSGCIQTVARLDALINLTDTILSPIPVSTGGGAIVF